MIIFRNFLNYCILGYSQVNVLNTNPGATDFANSLTDFYRGTFIPFGHPNIQTNVTGILFLELFESFLIFFFFFFFCSTS
jgi:hypothetical protein